MTFSGVSIAFLYLYFFLYYVEAVKKQASTLKPHITCQENSDIQKDVIADLKQLGVGYRLQS